MESKTCTECGSEKPIDCFPIKHQKKWRHTKCKDCLNRYCREHYKANKQAYLDRNKARRKLITDFVKRAKEVPCSVCGGIFPPAAMDFDHRDPKEKVYEINHMVHVVNASISSIIAEISKCDVLCACCHRIRHNPEN